MANPNLTELLASLLSQNATDNPYAKINDPVIRPRVIPNTPPTGGSPYTPPPWGTPLTTVAPPGGVTPTADPSGSGRGGTAPGSGAYGGMTSAERDTLGKVATGLGVAGWANPGFSVVGGMIRGALANDKYGITGRRGEIGITEQDVRDAMDYGGMFAGKEAQATRDAQQAAKEAATMAGDTFGLGGPTETPTDPFGGNRQEAQDLGGTDPGSGFGGIGSGSSNAGASSGAEGGNTGAGGRDGEGGDGSGRGGDTDWRGGVRVGTPENPGKTVFGKVGKETAFFVPAIMERAGIQGREAEILRKLKAMVRILEGNKGATDSESPKAERKEHANGGRGK